MTVVFYTKDPAICRAMVGLAKQHGWTGSMLDRESYPDDYPILIFADNGALNGRKTVHGEDIPLSLGQAVERIRKGPPPQGFHWGTLAGADVMIYADHVQIGSLTLHWPDLNGIYSAAANARGAP